MDESSQGAVNYRHVGGHKSGRNKHNLELLGNSHCVEVMFRSVFKISQADEPVLITGETGTGKEHVARAIHNMGPRSDRFFQPIDCSTLPSTLIESELFGHVRGAFTGAIQDRKGLFEAAGNGTVFLDEIGEMPLNLQSKLLRVLQNREFRPVGSTRYVEVQARIIMATNLDLELAVKLGTFRQDLYFRLNILCLKLPPLRQRKEDIPLLANHFLARFSERKEGDWSFSPDAMKCLKHHSWPGNVRELENAIRCALVWSEGPIVQVADLPMTIQVLPTDSPIEVPVVHVPTHLWDIERQAILRAIVAANGDKHLAAHVLGIGTTTIYRKLKEYGISLQTDLSSFCE